MSTRFIPASRSAAGRAVRGAMRTAVAGMQIAIASANTERVCYMVDFGSRWAHAPHVVWHARLRASWRAGASRADVRTQSAVDVAAGDAEALTEVLNDLCSNEIEVAFVLKHDPRQLDLARLDLLYLLVGRNS